MTASDKPQMELVAHYRELVEAYEALDSKIDELIMANGGKSEDMSAEDMRLYREWAGERNEMVNEMRLLERQLNLMEDDASSPS
jgi:L-fucose isomerase-like protein